MVMAASAANGNVALTADALKQTLQDTDFFNNFTNILDLSDVSASAAAAKKR